MTARHHTEQDLAALTGLLDGLTADLPPERQQRLKDHLVTEFRRSAARRSPVPRLPLGTRPRGPRHRRRAAWVIGAGVVGLAAAVTALSVPLPGGPALPLASKGAAQLLAKVAAAAAAQPAPHVRDSQYVYVETRVAYWHPSRPIPAGHFPRRIHLTMITSQVWSPVANVCRTGL